MKGRLSRAFTLIELLVVVAIIALLLSILLPSLAGAREQGKRATCLANLSNIGKSLWQYANDDSKESAVPISLPMRWEGLYHYFHRTAMWFSWGGKSGELPWIIGGVKVVLDDPNTPYPGGAELKAPIFAANRRPLTNFMFGGNINEQDRKKLDMFRCPSDTGYPDDQATDDIDRDNIERPLYAMVGNSYRASLIYSYRGQAVGESPYSRAFTVGPWGNKLSTLGDTARLVWMGEPAWFNMIKQDSGTNPNPNTEDLFGWHKRKYVDNLLFVDGSARSTVAEREEKLETETASKMAADTSWIARFGSVRLDTYPVGGARIWGNIDDIIQRVGPNRWPVAKMSDLYGQAPHNPGNPGPGFE